MIVAGKRYCDQCRRKLFPNEGDLCNRCAEEHEMNAQSHEALYGHEERERDEESPRYYWSGDEWHWYEDEQ